MAWLPSGSFVEGRHAALVPLVDARWSPEVDVLAYRLRSDPRELLDRLWERIGERPAGTT